MEDIYGVVDVSNFHFTVRCAPFDWRLLHGVDVDELVRLNNTAVLEALIPALQQGGTDAEPALSQQNFVQLFRLVQLSVEHLWHMRESHAKLYPAYVKANTAANSWTAAARSYLHLAGRLLDQLESDTGALVTEQVLSKVAEAREVLEKSDAQYNSALDKLEVEDKAARCHGLRRQRLEISWRLVFGVDMQQLISSGHVAQLEQLLPQVAYGNIMAEDASVLTPRHYRQLLSLGQACLDYLYAICMATSKVMEQQVQQLATASAAIPELTTRSEELRTALAAALATSMQLVQTATTTANRIQPQTCTHIQSSSPGYHCQHTALASVRASSPVNFCSNCASPIAATCPVHGAVAGCTCQYNGSGMVFSGTADGLLSSVLLPTAGNLRAKMEQLERDLRTERERTEAMRKTLQDATALLEQLPNIQQPAQQPAMQQPVQQTASTYAGQVSQPVVSNSGSRSESPSGGVRVVIDEEAVRTQERQAAGQQLSQHITDIIMNHEFSRKLRQGYSRHNSSGGSRSPNIIFSSVQAADAAVASGRGAGATAAATGSRHNTRSPRTSAGFAANMQVAAAAAAEAAASLAASAEAAAAAEAADSALEQRQQQQPSKGRLSLVPVFGLPGLVSPHSVGFQEGLPEGKRKAQIGNAAGKAEMADANAAALMYKQAGLMAAAAGAVREKQLQEQRSRPAGAAGALSKVKELARSVSPKRLFSGSGSGGNNKGASSAGPTAEGVTSCGSNVPSALSVAVSPAGSFSSRVAAKAAAELASSGLTGPASPAAQLSPLKAGIVLSQGR